MSFNKGYELKKFEAHWEKLRVEYAAAGMTEDAIQKRYDYDRQQFNAERAHLERTQELSTDTFECSEDENSPLMKRYREVTTVTDTYHETKAALHGSAKLRTNGCCLLLKIYRSSTSKFLRSMSMPGTPSPRLQVPWNPKELRFISESSE